MSINLERLEGDSGLTFTITFWATWILSLIMVIGEINQLLIPIAIGASLAAVAIMVHGSIGYYFKVLGLKFLVATYLVSLVAIATIMLLVWS